MEYSKKYPPAYEVHHTLDDEAVVVDLTAQVLVVFTTSDGAGCCLNGRLCFRTRPERRTQEKA